MICWIRRRHRSRASPARRTTWKGSITATASGSSSVVAVLNPVKPSIATTSISSRQAGSRSASHSLECLFGTALDHVEQPGWAGVVADRGEVDDHGDVLVAAPGVPPDVLIHADHGDAVEAVRVVDQGALAFGEDGVVGGVPRHPEPVGDPGHGEVLHHQAFQRPPQPAAGQLRPRLRGPAGVLPPHMPALAAAVAADGDVQAGGSPAERLVRQPADHGAARDALAAAAVAPVVGVDDPAREHRTIGVEALPGHDEPELVQAAEHGQVRAAEAGIRGSVSAPSRSSRWVSVRTSIFGRPRRLPSHRRADLYTLNCEEPSKPQVYLSAARACMSE